ncbi:hypothetical protein CLV98_11781 [Dyadobacter jejuensis]|uniref:Secreted protein (Por secretion system target) n=1 Tax=Dyadobacter jejuensis TaxID=1082580 RepID=A0A316AA47_9BACT|nr:hypothetical protein [Dyadobacter jejuensis]PWJ54543.1 hypothetical protein CLV98_11781 [Dyadobacter jejuensis]
MKNSIKTIAIALAIILTATLSGVAKDKGTKKAASFGTGIYTTVEGKINVMVDKAGAEYPTHLLVRDYRGTVVYRETISKKHTKFGRTLNLKELPCGTYDIDIISNGVRQTKTFELSEEVPQRTVKMEL